MTHLGGHSETHNILLMLGRRGKPSNLALPNYLLLLRIDSLLLHLLWQKFHEHIDSGRSQSLEMFQDHRISVLHIQLPAMPRPLPNLFLF